MMVTGKMLDVDLIGSGTTLFDKSPQAIHGTIAGSVTWYTLGAGNYCLNFPGSGGSQVNFASIGTVRTVVVWAEIPTATGTNHPVFRAYDSAIGDSASVWSNSGTMYYPDWTNCYINGVDTDSCGSGWKMVAITEPTGWDTNLFILGNKRAGMVETMLTGKLGLTMAFSQTLSQSRIMELYSSTRRLYI